jgi:nicotinate-nucleotide adenylyltransferase
MRIGLLGGSFDPAHEAHRAISLTAIKRLGLDRVWWLVSPGNPLKPAPASLEERLAAAAATATHPRIVVTDIEARLGSRYTVDTTGALRRRVPGVRFVWIMGADNLARFDRWRDWRGIFRTLPIAVIDRPGYRLKALSGKAAHSFASRRLDESDAALLPFCAPPAWVYLTAPLHDLSSTAIREGHRPRHSPTTY